MCCISCIATIFDKKLQGDMLIGRRYLRFCGLCVFGNGQTIAVFQISGKVDVSSEQLTIDVIALSNCGKVLISILREIPSIPTAFDLSLF